MVKTEPNIIRGRLITLVWFGYIIYGALYAFTIQPAYSSPFIMVLSPVFVGLINIGAAIAQVRFWRKQDQRRQQAAQGDQNLIAEQQPISDTTMLVLPITITQRTAKGWTIVLVIAILLFLAFVVFAIVTLLQEPHFIDDTITSLILVLVLAVFSLFIIGPIVQGYQMLIVDEQGISVRVGFGRTHHIEWDEATLFAISAVYKQLYGVTLEKQLPAYYELSNEKEIVRWRWVRTRNFIAIEPTLPIAEYDEQMQAVLSLIAARTGMTLYDVRPQEQRL